MGSQYATTNSDGGGGGSFITDGTDLLVAAGGGGGSAQNANSNQDASLTAAVTNGAASQFGSAGAGYSTNGIHLTYGTYTTVAQSFTNGGNGQGGGQAGGWPGAGYGDGGFGGGGSACACSTGGGGGGGGFAGGGGGTNGPYISGFGGSSYTIPAETNVTATILPTLGDGEIVITLLCDPLVTTISSDTVCFGDEVTLHAESSGTGVISWDNGITDSVVFTPAIGATTYTATSTDVDDCPFEILITVFALPTVDSGSDIILCNVMDTLLYGTGASTYTWDNGITDSVSFTPPNGTTIYTVTGTDVNSCVNTASTSVSVGGPIVTAAITNEVVTADGAIDVSVTGGTGTYTYLWGNGPITQDISGLTAGTYTLEVNDGICTTDTSFTILNVAGINSEESNNISLYPNPTNGLVTISLDGQFTYDVFNILGEIVVSEIGFDQESIDLSSAENGVYFVQISNGVAKQTVKLIKQ
jgi:hypothetical protein